jgi:hypothetical protein
MIALFLFDINIAFLPIEADIPAVILMIISLLVLFADVFFSLYAKSNYWLSFYMFLDIVGNLSLVPDILEILMNHTDSGATNDLRVARAGRIGRLARTANSLRFTKFARLFRVIRLIRVARIFRILHSRFRVLAADLKSDNESHTPSKLGIVLSDTVSRSVPALCSSLSFPFVVL